ncbi:methyltransferase domain-containing protein [Streptosporangium sp. DT93]|uniref:methyltransferase domain-containing protein n=1 Tax=Streptosporangium sp. DT93 TaxID=3393428 RepID=UPI003CF8A85E
MFAERVLSRVVYGSRYDRVPRHHRSYVRPGERLVREVRWRLRIGRTPVLRFQDYRERILLEGAERFVTCRLCGETRQQPLFQRAGAGRGGNYRVVRCPACGLLYRNPAVLPAGASGPAGTPAVLPTGADARRAGRRVSPVAVPGASPPATPGGGTRRRPADRRRQRYRLTMDAFGPVFSSGHGRRLLDVGRGTGLFLRLAAERGFDVAGLDLPAGSVTAATGHRPGTRPGLAGNHLDLVVNRPDLTGARSGLAGDRPDLARVRSGLAGIRSGLAGPCHELAGTRPDLAGSCAGLAGLCSGRGGIRWGLAGDGAAGVTGGGFDVITLWSVLARLPRPLEDLRCLRDLLAPGGVLLILTANAASLQLKAYGDGWRGFTRDGLMFYSAETLVTLLSRTGFAGVAFAPFYGDGVEAGAVGLPGRMNRRLRRNVETGGGKMLRALAFADEEAVGRWSERLGAHGPSRPRPRS